MRLRPAYRAANPGRPPRLFDEADKFALQLQGLDRLAEGQPEDPVREGASDLVVVDEIDGEHGLADAAHPVQTDPPPLWRCAGDADSSIGTA